MEGINNIDELLENEEFVQIRGYPNYIISNQGRCYNSKTKKFVGYVGNDGYIQVGLSNEEGQQYFRMHRLVMQHFGPPQPEDKPEIDHINHQRDDNRIENLRWVTRSENIKNRTGANKVIYEFVDEIPADVEDIIEVRDYGNHEFDDLYYADGYFYFDTGVNFRRLHINFTKTGSAYVWVYDVENKQAKIYYTKFKKLYGLN